MLWSGSLLMICGVVHIPIWWLSQGSWEGSVSWRKPILFGISTGMTLWSLSWLATRIRRQASDLFICWVVAASLFVEVFLITLQQWLGRASHFNQSTLFDQFIDYTMVLLICIAFVGICYFTIRSFGPIELDDDYALATRIGMVFLVISCLIGFVISFYGYRQISAGLPSDRIGENGVAKFPHGIAIHVLQILPIAVFCLRLVSIKKSQRVAIIYWMTVSFSLQLLFAIHQTVNGYDRLQLQSLTGFLIFCFAIGSLLIPMITVARHARIEK